MPRSNVAPTRQVPRRSFAGVVAIIASLVTVSAVADTPPTAVLTMRLTVRNDAGQVGCTLYASAAGFPKDPTAAAQRKWCAIAHQESICVFDPIPAGTYAVACFHDENKNGKFDTGLFGIPVEGSVASNNAKGFMGPPSFKDAKFTFSAQPIELRLKMSY